MSKDIFAEAAAERQRLLDYIKQHGECVHVQLARFSGDTPGNIMAQPKEKNVEQQELKEGQLVQLNPETVGNPMFAACIMVVTEPKAFGAQGYVQGLGADGKPGGQAYYRAKWEEMEPVGMAEWVSA